LIPIAAVEVHMGWSNTWQANSLSITTKLMADDRVDHLTVPWIAALQRRHHPCHAD
jgi:hypothetical protein